MRDPKLFNNIIIKKELSDQMMLVNSDQKHLSQVVINLVMNAVAAMEEGGTLTLRTYRDKPAKKGLPGSCGYRLRHSGRKFHQGV